MPGEIAFLRQQAFEPSKVTTNCAFLRQRAHPVAPHLPALEPMRLGRGGGGASPAVQYRPTAPAVRPIRAAKTGKT